MKLTKKLNFKIKYKKLTKKSQKLKSKINHFFKWNIKKWIYENKTNKSKKIHNIMKTIMMNKIKKFKQMSLQTFTNQTAWKL